MPQSTAPPQRPQHPLAMQSRDLFSTHATDVLACMLAINPRSVSRWLTGQNQFPDAVLELIREVLTIAQRNVTEQRRRDAAKTAERATG